MRTFERSMNGFLEIGEILPARGAHIDGGGHARGEQVRVGVHPFDIILPFGAEQVDVGVDVENPRRDDQPGDIHDLLRLRGGDFGRHAGDLARRDADIHRPVDAVGRVDDMPAL